MNYFSSLCNSGSPEVDYPLEPDYALLQNPTTLSPESDYATPRVTRLLLLQHKLTHTSYINQTNSSELNFLWLISIRCLDLKDCCCNNLRIVPSKIVYGLLSCLTVPHLNFLFSGDVFSWRTLAVASTLHKQCKKKGNGM